MAKTQHVLALDIGATSIKAGLFEYPPGGRIALVGYSYKEYDEELTDDNRTIMVAGLLREMLLESGFTCRKALVSISGQSAFIRFVKLPPVANDENRVRQIVEFEARQNVPFPIEQVIWDYQLLSKPEMDAELEVMFVVIKNEIVHQITAAVQAVGLDPVSLDVGPIASYNAARANHIGDDECAMILNIGGRSTSLLFADRQRFFARTIPIAGHSITQQIAKEFGIGFSEAEELKRRHGFVALGGAYEEPESEVAAAVSKIVRNVMARLHGEINRSVSVYRAQHKGQRPTRLYLAGGSSIMAFTDHFFAEKLRMEVSYLNPFRVMKLGPSVNRRELQEVAHSFSEVVGLGLRYRLECPVEISLVPETIVRQQALRRKKPYFFAAAACLLLLLFVTLMAIERKAGMYQTYHREVEGKIGSLQELANQINAAQSDTETVKAAYESIEKFLERRYTWPGILNEVQRLKPPDVWIESIKPLGQVPPAPEGGGLAGGGLDGGAGGMGMGAAVAGPGAGGGAMMGMGGDMGMGMGGPGGAGGMGMGSAGAGPAGAAGPGGMGMGSAGAGPGGAGGMGMGAAMGGGEAGGGLGGSETAAVPGDLAQIDGLEIIGHSVVLQQVAAGKGAEESGSTDKGLGPTGTGDAAGKTGGQSGKAVADPGKKEAALAAEPDPGKPAPADALPGLDEPAADEGELGDTGPPGATDGEGEGVQDPDSIAAEPSADKAATPELLFLARLRKAEMFESDKTYTYIRQYRPSDAIRNLSTFSLLVKFAEPVDLSE